MHRWLTIDYRIFPGHNATFRYSDSTLSKPKKFKLNNISASSFFKAYDDWWLWKRSYSYESQYDKKCGSYKTENWIVRTYQRVCYPWYTNLMRDYSVRDRKVGKEYSEKVPSLLYRKENGIGTLSFEYLINPPHQVSQRRKLKIIDVSQVTNIH